MLSTRRRLLLKCECHCYKMRGLLPACVAGWADTEGVKTSIPGFHKAFESKLRDTYMGADTMLYLALEVGRPRKCHDQQKSTNLPCNHSTIYIIHSALAVTFLFKNSITVLHRTESSS